MNNPSTSDELLEFFKALADANRLKIVGILARQPTSVEDLADALGLGASTVSHHLAKLSRAGLVTARTDGHYYIYSLQTENLQAMAQRLLSEDNLPRLSQEDNMDAFDRKVIANFTDSSGRIKAFPAQEKKFQAIVRYVSQAFEPGVEYTEKQVNTILQRFSDDTAALRRAMVEMHLMDRQPGGSAYWLTSSKE